jgi:SAM-dependent methyltransferase
MPQAGMVHALEKIYQLLKPDGYLIDIHPTPEPAAIDVRLGDKVTPAGWLDEVTDYTEYEWADEALKRVTDAGLFALEHDGTFEFVWHAESVADLLAYLAEDWTDARIDPVTAMRVEEMLQTPEHDKELLVREAIRIARFSRK